MLVKEVLYQMSQPQPQNAPCFSPHMIKHKVLVKRGLAALCITSLKGSS